jgi:ABC-2 type transport system ATP-binding protein
MPDVFGSYENMRVTEYLDFFGSTFGIRRKDRIKRVQEVLDTTGSTYMKDKYVESLSHGMKQRVAIARTLLHDPELVILDEPANGLDPQARIEMREIILRLADMGKTIIVTSHILPELSRICNQVAIVIRGKLQAFGPLDKIMHDLTQLRSIEVQVANAREIKPAAQIIRKVTKERHKMTGSAAESMVRFQTEKTDAELSVVLAALVSKGIHVVQFRELQTDLEDAFMSATQKSRENDQAASKVDEVEIEEVEEVAP